MRALNSKAGSFVTTNQVVVDIDGKHPCWYANVEQAAKKRDYKWKVGCKHDGQVDEYEFKFSKVGNVSDKDLWDQITSSDFAIKLIETFKKGGQKSVKKWIKGGCP